MRMGPANIKQFWQFLEFHLGPQSYDGRHFMGIIAGREVDMPQLGVFVAFATVSYAAGQWTSMLIRSGIISAVAGVVSERRSLRLGAANGRDACELALVGCADSAGVDWGDLVALARLDWREQALERAGRAAAAVVLPAVALLIAVPVYRVHQIPFVAPGFRY